MTKRLSDIAIYGFGALFLSFVVSFGIHGAGCKNRWAPIETRIVNSGSFLTFDCEVSIDGQWIPEGEVAQ